MLKAFNNNNNNNNNNNKINVIVNLNDVFFDFL